MYCMSSSHLPSQIEMCCYMEIFDIVSVHVFSFGNTSLVYALSYILSDVPIADQVNIMLDQGLVDSSTRLGKY